MFCLPIVLISPVAAFRRRENVQRITSPLAAEWSIDDNSSHPCCSTPRQVHPRCSASPPRPPLRLRTGPDPPLEPPCPDYVPICAYSSKHLTFTASSQTPLITKEKVTQRTRNRVTRRRLHTTIPYLYICASRTTLPLPTSTGSPTATDGHIRQANLDAVCLCVTHALILW